MIWAFIVMALGALAWFVPAPYGLAVLVLIFACWPLYIRAMRKRAKADVQ